MPAPQAGRNPRVPFTADEIATMKRQYVEEKLALWEVAATNGTTIERVRRTLKANGVTMRPANGQNSKTPEEKALFVRLYREGMSIVAICKELFVCRTSVVKALDEAGVPQRPKNITAEESAEIAKLYTEGLSAETIGTKLGRPLSTVLNHVRRNGIPLRPRGGKNHTKRAS